MSSSSFFGKKSVDEEPKGDGVYLTGKKIDEIVQELVSLCEDGDSGARYGMTKSLQDIGKKQPNLVIGACADHIRKNAKGISTAHRVRLLNIINHILEQRRDQLSPHLALPLLQLAMSEMTADSKEVLPEWQGAASTVLVSLGIRFPNEIINELLGKFNVGTLPHYFIIKTLGDFATANPLDVVVRLKEIFARVLPVLASVKQDNMKWVFASAIGQFCDAVMSYVANIDRAKNKDIGPYTFSGDVFPAYEIIFSNWLQAKEAKVRTISIQALGCISACLERETFETNLIKLIPTILNIYKKEKDQLPVTQGLNVVLDVCVKDGSRVLEPQLNVLMANLYPLVCVIPEGNNSNAIKNYNELLRCFQTLGLVFSDEIATFLLEKLNSKQSSDIKMRVGGLALLKHLVTRLVKQFEDKRGLLVTGIKPLIVNEKELRIKRELAQVIISMAVQDYLSQEGGETLVEFILINASISDEDVDKDRELRSKEKEPNPNAVTLEELRNLCDNILNLAATTIDCMHGVLYPFLLEALVNPKYSICVGTICKAVGHIGGVKRESDDSNYFIDFDRAVNLPKPQSIIARLMVILNAPLRRGNIGMNALQAMKSLGPILHPSICDMWDAAIPKLVNFLETNTADFKAQTWEDLILRLLAETIKVINDDDWTAGYANQLFTQIDMYANDHELKRVSFKHLGLTLQKLNHRETVRTKLEGMIGSVNPNNEAQKLGFAQGMGYCSVTHLDMVLEKLQNPPKPVVEKKGGFFSSSKKPADGPTELNNATVLAYGYVAAYSQPTLITARIDVSIINHLKPAMPKMKSLAQKETLLKTIELIAKAMHPSHLKKEYILKQRDDLLRQVISMMYTLPSNAKGAKPEEISDAVLNAALQSAINKIASFYSIPQIKDAKMMEGVNTVFTSLLASDPTIECLCRIFLSVEPVVRSNDPAQRERATGTVLFLLKKLAEIKASDLDNPDREKSFVACGNTIAMLIPRVTDSVAPIRQSAVHAIHIALYIDYILKTNLDSVPRLDSVRELASFGDFRNRIDTEELNEQFSIAHEMSRELSKLVNRDELPQLLANLLVGLTDVETSSTSGACVVLNGMIKLRGGELLAKVPEIVAGITKAMESISSDQTMNGTLHTVQSLAHHHLQPVLDQLLTSPIPHATFIVKSFHAIGEYRFKCKMLTWNLARDDSLLGGTIDHLLDLMSNGQLYEDKSDVKGKEGLFNPRHIPMSATCALKEILLMEKVQGYMTDNYGKVLSHILLRIGSCNGLANPDAAEQAVSTLSQFAERVEDEGVLAAANKDGIFGTMKAPNFHLGVAQYVSAVCRFHPEVKEELCQVLLPYLKGNYVGQKILVASVFAQLVEFSGGNLRLLDFLINRLLAGLVDSSIKIHCIVGLGNIVAVGIEDGNKYAPTILDALLSSIDDRDDNIAQQAMNGLAKVFGMADEQRISPILVNICHRIRPAFDKDNNDIRAASFNLLGALFRFGNGSAAEPFYEQLHNNLPAILVHVDDPNAGVRTSCRAALRTLAPLFREESVTQLLEQQLDPSSFFQYNEFLNDLSKLLVECYPDRINYYVMTSIDYFKSHWNEIKINATALVGFILTNLPVEKRKACNLSPSLFTKALIALLKEKDPDVRKAAAESMSLLYDY
ncbi:hypothetical protein PROFUN_09434 [Planoprotostelium fungivorum]|uniref:Uncharacterized protein n=1 Tax=Planoprotostelium fungivorum TaxID=1890364 RepID=A0A2P6NHG7_9EUKA|nr:hypothetical protein PROFUN_09434 [Planoprotostelium fungivorum]